MRIAQTLRMRDFRLLHATVRLVACALTAGIILLLHLATAGSRNPAAAQQGSIDGVARVVDGDTIVVGDTRIRLEGIDAPEAGQTCTRRPAGEWHCGTEATAALAARVEGKLVRCEATGTDRYRRTLAICFLGAEDVNAWMVRQGHAWAFVRYSQRYVTEEGQARAMALGIWQGEATPAWEHRARRWTAVEAKSPEGCAIKGNVTARGRIYHMPWSPWYAQIDMAAGGGRRWFCTEAEALAAGWRPVNLERPGNKTD
jgi:endonuclease YncB( thermonuclease family)